MNKFNTKIENKVQKMVHTKFCGSYSADEDDERHKKCCSSHRTADDDDDD